MKDYKYKVWFANCNYEPEAVIVNADNMDEAVILAKAKRINCGKDYTLDAIQLVCQARKEPEFYNLNP
jgi:hypothetical protein